MKRVLFPLIVVWLVFPAGGGAEEVVGKKGKIQGQSHVNLRSGPDLSRPARGVLKEGTEVRVEGEEASWYRVSLTDGRKGYVHKKFVRLLEATGNQEVASVGSAAKGEKKNTLQQPAPKAAAAPPTMKASEEKESGILWWSAVGLCVFVLGWICGGNYYLRRDRVRRTKLRF